jgi:threonine dehydratase
MTVSVDEIQQAAERLHGYAVKTPLLHSAYLDERLQCQTYLKAECLQRTGWFKFRGAFNRLSALVADGHSRGVIAWSSGNHAQGIAAAAGLLNLKATIVMPSDAPTIKIENTKALGAEIVFYDRHTESREEISRSLADKHQLPLVPSFDDLDVICGQGTVRLEVAQDLHLLRATPDIVLVPCGGGGLSAGIATALKAAYPNCSIYAVEPVGHDDTARSLRVGAVVSNHNPPATICDARLASHPGALTFPINQRLLSGGLVVTDEEVRAAMHLAFLHLKLILEGGGAVALAALLSGKIETRGLTVFVILSGGNVDPQTYVRVLSHPRP